VEVDLALLHHLTVTASRHSALARQWDIVGLVAEFGQVLRAELDYTREGRNVQRVVRAFAGHPELYVPRIQWQTSTERLLTLDRMRGIKINDLSALDAAGIDRPALAQRAARILPKMVFEDGFFHADPLPGNFFVGPDGSIGLIDFGLVGAVNDLLRDELAEQLMAMSDRDTDRLVDALLELGVSSQHVNREAMRHDVDQLVATHYGQPLSKIALGPLLDSACTIARHHRLRFPQDLTLLVKAAGMCEGIGAQLDPTFGLCHRPLVVCRDAGVSSPVAKLLVAPRRAHGDGIGSTGRRTCPSSSGVWPATSSAADWKPAAPAKNSQRP
jgi:ubiquinone biosynthesis protein